MNSTLCLEHMDYIYSEHFNIYHCIICTFCRYMYMYELIHIKKLLTLFLCRLHVTFISLR